MTAPTVLTRVAAPLPKDAILKEEERLKAEGEKKRAAKKKPY